MSSADVVRLEGVSFRYEGQATAALDDVSLHIGRGELVVVMGRTGAGKSTLAKCLNRTVPTFQAGTLVGDVWVLGIHMRHEGVADLAGRVGMVSQDFEAQLFATNVTEEVAFGMEQLGVPVDEMRRRLPDALATVGLSGFEGRDPTTLSGGEKQRLAIAAALAMAPEFLVFDEPTTDLDPLGKLEIFDVLATMRRRGHTMLLVEHETAAAERADRLVILDRGRVVASDRPALVLADADLLLRHGVRPPDLARIARRFSLPLPGSVDEAAAALGKPSGSAPPASAAPTGGSVAGAVLVEVRAVDFAYEPGALALRAVSLTVRAGEFVALIGQNGSGKTTLAKHLNGLLRPSRGLVLLSGKDVARLPLHEVAREVGYVFQNPDHQIFAPTVRAEVGFGPTNLGWSAADVAARVAEALDAVGLSGCEDEDPFMLGKGERQRLAVASLLALRPRLLILDEPTTGLDYTEQVRMMDLVARLHRQGTAILMITHSPWVVAEYAERGVLMRDGAIQFDGPLRDLMAQDAVLAAAHFRAPDVTQLGTRFGFTPLSVDEFVAAFQPSGSGHGGADA